MTAKREKTLKDSRLSIYVEVLQNGAVVATSTKPLRGRGEIKLTSKKGSDLSLLFYPFPHDELYLATVNKNHIYLEKHRKLEGFCTSRGEIVDIKKGKRSRKPLELHRGDYASLTYDDLRILIRIAPSPSVKKAKTKLSSKYRAGMFGHFIRGRDEARGLIFGTCAAAVLVGGFTLGLLKRHHERPQRIEDLKREYILPFVASDHLRLSPEALQGHLNRHAQVKSVMHHYQALAAVLMGWRGYDTSTLMPTTIAMYEKLHASVRTTLSEKLASQRKIDDEIVTQSEQGIITIPTIMGESASGSMLRAIDKVEIMHKALEINYAAKNLITSTFKADPGYKFDEYRNITPASSAEPLKGAEALGSAFKRPSAEQLMYQEAESLAKEAKHLRQIVVQGRSANEPLKADSNELIALPAASKLVSFDQKISLASLDYKLRKLQGSPYSEGPKEKPRAPLVGEMDPALIEKYITQHRFQLQICYELALRRNERMTGVMEWRFRIDPRGLVGDVGLISSSIRDHAMTACVRDKISSWKFPRPRRGSVEISYPFEFHPARG